MINCSLLLLHVPNLPTLANQPETSLRPKEAAEAILGDTLDRELSAASLCKDCARRARVCAQCKWVNNQASLQEVEEAEILWKNMTVMTDPLNSANKIIVRHYKLDAPIELL